MTGPGDAVSENATESDLSPKMRRALETYTLTGDAAAAATAAGVSRQTVYRWLREPVFIAELRRLDAGALETLGRRIIGLGAAAATAIEDALQPSQPIGIRLRAAALVLERGPELAELTSILQRLDALEAQGGQSQ
jgi:hypothetical protein